MPFGKTKDPRYIGPPVHEPPGLSTRGGPPMIGPPLHEPPRNDDYGFGNGGGSNVKPPGMGRLSTHATRPPTYSGIDAPWPPPIIGPPQKLDSNTSGYSSGILPPGVDLSWVQGNPYFEDALAGIGGKGALGGKF